MKGSAQEQLHRDEAVFGPVRDLGMSCCNLLPV